MGRKRQFRGKVRLFISTESGDGGPKWQLASKYYSCMTLTTHGPAAPADKPTWAQTLKVYLEPSSLWLPVPRGNP
jgi:hypothetical protein